MKTLSSISILVVDDNEHPREYAEVSIYWQSGGASTGRTGKSGQVTLASLGTIDRITVFDKVVQSGPVHYPSDVSLRYKT